tara:strand:+ start:456 stop:1136 length:681 start_codon:yes stop_codon:yes gene_type:complete
MSWITESAKRGSELRKHYTMHDIEIFIKDPLPPVIDADFIFKYIASILPAYLMTEVDIVYVGQFEDLKKREVNAIFEDGAIFVTNEQSSEMDLIDDIVHEIAHSIEKKYVDRIYGDGSLEREFKRKRRKLYDTLKQKGKNPPPELITNIHYSQAVDDYFFRVVGYSVLGQISAFEKLFTGPYSATSIREYFATGFDQYFLGEEMLVRNFSPALYKILAELSSLEEQ